MTKNWLVTGSSRGLGRAIAEKALREGDAVLATARDARSLSDLEQAFPATLSTFELDVTDSAQAHAAAAAAVTRFGRVDVLVNNAGYGVIAPFEQTSEAHFRQQIETNLFGVVNMTRALLPFLRKQRAGHVINISSIGGRVGVPGLSAYQAAKWAVGGFTEVVAKEVAPFGVHMISLEPGGMRTGWGASAATVPAEMLPDYRSTVGTFLNGMSDFVGHEIGDPARVAQVVFDLTRRNRLPLHLILGSDALRVFDSHDAERRRSAEEWKEVSLSTDFPDGEAGYLDDGRLG